MRTCAALSSEASLAVLVSVPAGLGGMTWVKVCITSPSCSVSGGDPVAAVRTASLRCPSCSVSELDEELDPDELLAAREVGAGDGLYSGDSGSGGGVSIG